MKIRPRKMVCIFVLGHTCLCYVWAGIPTSFTFKKVGMRYLYKVHAMPCLLVTSRRGAFLAMCLHGYIAYTKHCGGKGKCNSPFNSNGVDLKNICQPRTERPTWMLKKHSRLYPWWTVVRSEYVMRNNVSWRIAAINLSLSTACH